MEHRQFTRIEWTTLRDLVDNGGQEKEQFTKHMEFSSTRKSRPEDLHPIWDKAPRTDNITMTEQARRTQSTGDTTPRVRRRLTTELIRNKTGETPRTGKRTEKTTPDEQCKEQEVKLTYQEEVEETSMEPRPIYRTTMKTGQGELTCTIKREPQTEMDRITSDNRKRKWTEQNEERIKHNRYNQTVRAVALGRNCKSKKDVQNVARHIVRAMDQNKEAPRKYKLEYLPDKESGSDSNGSDDNQYSPRSDNSEQEEDQDSPRNSAQENSVNYDSGEDGERCSDWGA
jgi:hypothetical protein